MDRGSVTPDKGRAQNAWVLPLMAGIAGTLTVYAVAGVSLNGFLGSAAYAAAMTPIIAVHYHRVRWRAVLAFVIAIVSLWYFAMVDRSIQPVQYLSLCAVLMAVLAAQTATGETLERIGVPPSSSCLLVLIASAIWLAWPVWGSLRLNDAGAPFTTLVHPLLAINSAVPELGIWTEQTIPYRLSSLGQDVAYRLPPCVWPCVLLHGAVAVILFAASGPWRGRLGITPLFTKKDYPRSHAKNYHPRIDTNEHE